MKNGHHGGEIMCFDIIFDGGRIGGGIRPPLRVTGRYRTRTRTRTVTTGILVVI